MTRHRWLAPLAVVSLVVAACGGSQPSSAPAASGGTEPSGAAPSASAAAADQQITYVIDSDLSGGLSNAADNVPTAEATQFLYDGIYEFDETLTPVPDLATDLATISDDGLTWTVSLKPGVTFHDGTDLTAEDVVQTYQLAQSPNCTYSPATCLNAFLDNVDTHRGRFGMLEDVRRGLLHDPVDGQLRRVAEGAGYPGAEVGGHTR